MTPDEIVAMAERLGLPPLLQWQIDVIERFAAAGERPMFAFPRIGGRVAVQRILDEFYAITPPSAEGTPTA